MGAGKCSAYPREGCFLKKKSEYKTLCAMIDTVSSPKRPVISKPFLICNIFLLCRKYKPVLPVFVSSYSTVGGGMV